jgi:branched-subunit amino acid aminotransferase/4-amino-4-deoxychorismate lyase
LPGITRALVLDLCAKIAIPAAERPCPKETLEAADGLFFSLATRGIVAAASLDDRVLFVPKIVHELHAAYRQTLVEETRAWPPFDGTAWT